MHRHFHLRGLASAIALAVALPFNALAAEPTPDPPEPYLIGTVATGVAAVMPGPSSLAAPK
jgi:hypothetical protein